MIAQLICKLMGHKWTRMLRSSDAAGTRRCKRCGKVESVAMRPRRVHA